MILSFFIFWSLATVTSAHSNGPEGFPKLMGARNIFSELKARNYLQAAGIFTRGHQINSTSSIEKRVTSDGRCGPGLGSCTNCCSAEGYCGSGPEYCISPDCQYEYGPECDANKKPGGPSTANIRRPLIGDVPYGGAGIYDCVTPGTVAFTYDDGPYLYTNDVLDKFKRYNAHATFFITGNNLGKGPIDSTPKWSNVIKRMVAEGHQVASHTWTHQSLDKVDGKTFQNQVIYNEMDFNVDTAGYLNTDVSQIRKSKDIWDATIAAGNPTTSSFLEIEHDIHYQIAYNLTDHILESIYSHGYRSVTVGECLGDPPANWYRTGKVASTPHIFSADGCYPSLINHPIYIILSIVSYYCRNMDRLQKEKRGNFQTILTIFLLGCGETNDPCSLIDGGNSNTSPAPPPKNNATSPTFGMSISADGSCSSTTTCLGSSFGNCCSEHGWCGSSLSQ